MRLNIKNSKNAFNHGKVYNNFSDKFGNEYGFVDYASFSTFWFNLSRKNAMNFFPNNFKELQRAATVSKEALQKVLPKNSLTKF